MERQFGVSPQLLIKKEVNVPEKNSTFGDPSCPGQVRIKKPTLNHPLMARGKQ